MTDSKGKKERWTHESEVALTRTFVLALREFIFLKQHFCATLKWSLCMSRGEEMAVLLMNIST